MFINIILTKLILVLSLAGTVTFVNLMLQSRKKNNIKIHKSNLVGFVGTLLVTTLSIHATQYDTAFFHQLHYLFIFLGVGWLLFLNTMSSYISITFIILISIVQTLVTVVDGILPVISWVSVYSFLFYSICLQTEYHIHNLISHKRIKQ